MNTCKAQDRSARGGYCIAWEGHSGDHYAWHVTPPGYKFYWPQAEPPLPSLKLTAEEVNLLKMLVDPVKQFYPKLAGKIDRL